MELETAELLCTIKGRGDLFEALNEPVMKEKPERCGRS